ncbi:SCO2523 family variant P-loop protein [Dactylosporangium sp. NPDC049742]|uniref:SCO2523 family variant P-loop protein n=1 Tax=Dactylosporangium sp. NPDC049742 TaxID=3154737 RepID=UPI0034441915
MLVFAASDKGGTGRSVTSSNLVYRSALAGNDVCYLDFDFGSPTTGAIFQINSILRGTSRGGLHSYLDGSRPSPERLDVWAESDRKSLRQRPAQAGRMVLFPGDRGKGEFPIDKDIVDRCVKLFLQVEEEFDLALIDLSSGRSYATEMVLAATARPELQNVGQRWLIFHRWTRQHVLAAANLVYGEGGILAVGKQYEHKPEHLTNSLRFVRTAVVNPDGPDESANLEGLRPAQASWLKEVHQDLLELANQQKVGRTLTLGEVPLDPVLQWREQLISDNDVSDRMIANAATVDAFELLAEKIMIDSAWGTP